MALFLKKEQQLLTNFASDLQNTSWKIIFSYDKYHDPFIKFAHKDSFSTRNAKIYKKFGHKWHGYNNNSSYFYDESFTISQLVSNFKTEIKEFEKLEQECKKQQER